jgi:HlyD family secretion protein
MKLQQTRNWLIGTVCLVLAGVLAWSVLSPGQILAASTTSTATKEAVAERGNVTAGVTESGMVSIGTLTQSFDLDPSGDSGAGDAADLAALEVLSLDARIGQVLCIGDPLLTVTEESLAEVRARLESAVQTAQSELTAAVLEHDKEKLAATYALKANQALGTTAQATYDTTIAQLNIDVADAQQAIADANERIAEIPGDISDLEDEIDDLDDDDDSARIYSLRQTIDDLQEELATLENSLPVLDMKKAKVEREREAGITAAQAALASQKLLNQNAQAIYQVAVTDLDEAVQSAQDALDAAQSDLTSLTQVLSGSQILSQYAGTLTALGYAAGDTLNAATDIATIQNPAAVTVEVDVAQDDISLVAIGSTVNVEFSAYPDELYQGTVTAISASVTDFRTSTVSYPVTVTLSGDTGKIYDGMTGNVTFITREVADVIHVSNKAILLEGTQSFVKRKRTDGTMEKVQVETGFSNGYQVEIKSGLAEGDVVLIESQVNG